MSKLLARLAMAGAALSIATSAQAADVANPSAPAYSAVIEMFGGYSMFKDVAEFSDENEQDARKNNPIMGGFAAVNLPLSQGMSIQMDMLGSNLFVPDSDSRVDDEMIAGNLQTTIHLSGRNDQLLFGGFGGLGQASFQDEEAGTFMFGGAEIQAYLGSTTLYLQGGYLDSYQADSDEDDTLSEAFFARGVMRVYPSETNRLSAEVGYAVGNHEEDIDGRDVYQGNHEMSILGWGARFDQQISETPAKVFLAYQGSRFDFKDKCEVGYEHRVMLGVSFAFGSDTIMANDRQGVALDTQDLGPWVAIGEADTENCNFN
jgi:opacity protein-like surface antigen